MAREALFPKDEIGHHVTEFDSFSDVQPIICFFVSLAAASLGMSRFIMLGPVPISSSANNSTKDFVINGILMVMVNLIFSFRLFAIEAIFFSYYQGYKSDWTKGEEILPLVKNDKFRILFYLLPSLISILANNIRLAITFKDTRKLYLLYPQILLVPGFSPFMYEWVEDLTERGKETTRIRIWKKGSIINAIYTGIIPMVGLIISENARGAVHWNFEKTVEVPHKYTNIVIKTAYGNMIFAITGLVVSSILIALIIGRLFRACSPEKVCLFFKFFSYLIAVEKW